MERTRLQGTVETVAETGEERIMAIRRVVEAKQYAKIDGQMMDVFSASAIVAVYDKLSPSNQDKYAACSAPHMARIAFKLLG